MGCYGEPLGNYYSAILLMSCYAVGELGHFLIGIISRTLTQDIQFGDQGCIANTSTAPLNVTCSEFTNEEACNITGVCRWDYLGSGIEYQLLAGPSFIAVFSVMGVIIAIVGDTHNRVRLLSLCVVMFSLMAFLTGFATQYWQLVLLRTGYGAGEAGCAPLTAGIIADKFSTKRRAFGMSIFSWGIYFGYGLAFAVGNYVTAANINGMGWRWSYILTALAGFFVVTVLFFTVKEPQRKRILFSKTPKIEDPPEDEAEEEKKSLNVKSTETKTTNRLQFFPTAWLAIKLFSRNSSILMLLLAASVRHTASFCWAYNTQIYFDVYYPGTDLGMWMTLCSIVGGSIGIASGGIISDLVVAKYGITERLWVLVGSQAMAAPLALLVLYLPPPYCFISLVSAYVFAEMWYGVTMTVLVEMVPLEIRSTSVALWAFVVANVGGNMPIVVAPLKHLVGGLRTALCIMFPGFYFLSSILFLLTQLLIRKNSARSNITL